jgi:hypothetical protein
MVLPQSLYAVTLGVRDVGRQRAFYEGWGWGALPYSTPEYAAFQLGDVVVAFFSRDDLAVEAAPGEAVAAPEAWNGVTLAIRATEREDADRLWRAAVKAGARPVAEPVDRPWGGRSGYVADPEGNRWEVVWVPPMPGE